MFVVEGVVAQPEQRRGEPVVGEAGQERRAVGVVGVEQVNELVREVPGQRAVVGAGHVVAGVVAPPEPVDDVEIRGARVVGRLRVDPPAVDLLAELDSRRVEVGVLADPRRGDHLGVHQALEPAVEPAPGIPRVVAAAGAPPGAHSVSQPPPCRYLIDVAPTSARP